MTKQSETKTIETEAERIERNQKAWDRLDERRRRENEAAQRAYAVELHGADHYL